MTTLFDGMGPALIGAFGGSLIHTPQGGASVAITGRFRTKPLEVFDDEEGRSSLIMEPTLRVAEPVASTIASDDLITTPQGVIYEVKNRHGSGSPAADALVIFKLREVI